MNDIIVWAEQHAGLLSILATIILALFSIWQVYNHRKNDNFAKIVDKLEAKIERLTDKQEENKERIHTLEVEIEKLKSEDKAQQQVIDQISKVVLDPLFKQKRQ